MSTVTKRRDTAYHGSKDRKARFLEEMRAHRKADRFLKGSTGRFKAFDLNNETIFTIFDSSTNKFRPQTTPVKIDFRGCGIACSVYSIKKIRKEKIDGSFYNHELVASHLGIDEDMAHAFENVFEGLSKEDAANWPIQFAGALRPGSQPAYSNSEFYAVGRWETSYVTQSEMRRDYLLELLRKAKPVVEVR
jgi:hypothetical protein